MVDLRFDVDGFFFLYQLFCVFLHKVEEHDGDLVVAIVLNAELIGLLEQAELRSQSLQRILKGGEELLILKAGGLDILVVDVLRVDADEP